MPERTSRCLVVSTDSHIGPSQEQLRPYCSPAHLDAFDEAARLLEARRMETEITGFGEGGYTQEQKEAAERTWNCKGSYDPVARAADMDAEGVSADVIFGGAQNGHQMPFSQELERLGGLNVRAGSDVELVKEGLRIWNRWLADFVSADPARHVGTMQLPITFDLDATVEWMSEYREAGLRAVNFPAPRSDFPSYNDPVYEDFWSACEDLELPLCTHVAGGDQPLGTKGPGGHLLAMSEHTWLSRRSLWQLIFSGVFERHPRLKLVFTEQRASWVEYTLRDLDSIFHNDLWGEHREYLTKTPSEYFASNCYIAASMLAPFEVDQRDEVGVDRLMWGGDYPHTEGTWPRTLASLRHAFASSDDPISDDEIRKILGENAIKAFGLDRSALRSIADEIGPDIDLIRTPLEPEDLPAHRGFAFRTRGMYS